MDVADCVEVITRESGASTASRARSALSSFFVWAMEKGLVESNPVIGSTKPSKGDDRTRVLTNDELVSIWRASTGDDDYSRCVRLLILTGCRRQEVGGMTRSEFDGIEKIPARGRFR